MYLFNLLRKLEDYFILPLAAPNSDPSWFGFPLVIKSNLVDRYKLIKYLEENNIKTRLIFAGNLTKQPYMKYHKYKKVGKLENSDIIMRNGFWVGIYPGITKENLNKISYHLHNFITSNCK